jgi:hypothetical protein
MTMTPYNTDLTRALKWMHNNAPNLQALINQKANWYQRYNTQFWTNWQENVFDIRTANAFGLVVWCIILGLPLDIFDFAPITNAFAFGAQRGNYLDGGGNVAPINFVSGPNIYNGGVLVPTSQWSLNETSDAVTFTTAPAEYAVLTWTGTVQNEDGTTLLVQQPRQFGTGTGSQTMFSLIPTDSGNYNEVGFNFYGGGNESVALLSEIRQACQLRYVALVSNGRQQWINQMLQYIFNAGDAWNFQEKTYFYLTDITMAVQVVTGAQIWRSDWEGNQLLYATARTNLCPNSQLLASSNHWTLSNCTITNSAGPDGTANGTALITPSSAAASYVDNSASQSGLALNTIYTMSLFVKAGSATNSFTGIYDSLYATLLCGIEIVWAGGTPTLTISPSSTGYVSGTLKLDQTGESGWYRVEAQFNNGTNAAVGGRIVSDSSNGTGTMYAAYPQLEQGLGATSYIPTTGSDATVTDYTLNASTGAVVMAVAPANGAILTWQGSWNWSSWTSPNQFGTGNGSNVDFTLTNPPGGAKPITQQYYMEYRVGASLNFSSQFLTILNNPAYGIMPQCAGTAYAVVQES